jgi:hypothetical protein
VQLWMGRIYVYKGMYDRAIGEFRTMRVTPECKRLPQWQSENGR